MTLRFLSPAEELSADVDALVKAVDALEKNTLVKAAGDLEKKSHAHYAPSKAHRWLVCPGSMQFLGEDPETEWAALGTRKHAVLEWVLSGKPPLIAGDIVPSEAGDYTVTLEVLEQCQEIKEFIEQFHQTDHGGFVVETETKVEIGSHLWPNMKPGDCDGTVDAAAYGYEELLVVDAKFGWVQVEARGNQQLYLYALGLLAEIPFPITRVTVCIAQPGYDGQVLFREHRISVDELNEWAFQQQPIVEENQRGSRRLQADDKACLWCPARLDCSARMQALEDAANDEWMAERSIEELLPYVPRLRAIARDIEQRAMAKLNVGEPVRGWKLVAAKSRRVWPADPDMVEKLATHVGYEKPPEEFYTRELKSPAQMEKVIRALSGKKLMVKEAKALVDTFAYQPQGGPKLVPDSDPRPALEAATWTLEDVLDASLEAGNGDD